MKNSPRRSLPRVIHSRSLKSLGLPLLVAVLAANSVAGQLVTPQKNTPVPSSQTKPMATQALADVPRYRVTPTPTAEPMAIPLESGEVVYLTPFVVHADQQITLDKSAVRTKRAVTAAILKEYDYSAFSLYQHRETVRLEDRATLSYYADSLRLAGDAAGSRELTRESNRLFMRPHDPETEYIDHLLNSRTR